MSSTWAERPSDAQRPSIERIRLMERGEKLLIMDRVSGRWFYVPLEHEGLVRMWGTFDLKTVPDGLRPYVEALHSGLSEREIGIPGSERTFHGFNTLILKLTNACNLACAYCYDFETFEKARRMELAIAHKALSQAIDLCSGRLSIILHGGEPMLVWPMVEELVLAAELRAGRSGVTIEFNGQTNMTKLTPQIVRFCEAHQIKWGVSLDGRAPLHDAYRLGHDGKGSFGAFLKALDEHPAFVRACPVMSTVTAATQHTLLDSARYFHELGMAAWDWSLFQPIGRGRTHASFEIDVPVLLAAWDELFDAVIAGEFDGFPIHPVKKYLDNFFHGPGQNMCLRGPCGAARDLLSTSVDGTIEGCDCIDPKGDMANLGNVLRDGLAGAIASPAADRLRSRDVGSTECGRCIWYGVCGGSCMAHAGSVHGVDAVGCAAALNAFDRISMSLASGSELQRYMQSLA